MGKEKGNRASGSAVFAEPIETDNIALQRAERSCLANQAAEVLQAQVLELIHYPATGATRAGLHLLFVHGAYSSASCWQPHFLPWFSRQGYDCWAVSLRGHGNSPDRRHLQQYAIADYVNDVAWACGQLAQPAVLIGHSMGGFVLQQYLRQHTAAATILLASVPPGGLLASTWRLGLTAPDILLVLNLFQQGRYQPTAEEIRRMLLSPDASLRHPDPIRMSEPGERQVAGRQFAGGKPASRPGYDPDHRSVRPPSALPGAVNSWMQRSAGQPPGSGKRRSPAGRRHSGFT